MMTFVDFLFQTVIQFSLVSFVLLGICLLAVKGLGQPLERIRVIQVSMIASLMALILIGSNWQPSFARLNVLPAIADSNLPVFDSDRARTNIRSMNAAPMNAASVEQSQNSDSMQVADTTVAKEPAAETGKLHATEHATISNKDDTSIESASNSTLPGVWTVCKATVSLGFLMMSLFQTLRIAIGFLATRRLLRTATPLCGRNQQRARAMLDSIRSSDCKTVVQFARSKEIDVPMVHGAIRPTILLSDWLLDDGNEVALEQSLAHEWKHIANGDLITWQMMTFCQIFLGCQPFYWSLRKTLRLSQDQLADHFVAETSDAPADYAETLLTFSKSNQTEFQGALAMAGRKSDLYQRVECLLNKQRSVASVSRKRIVASFAIGLMSICFALCLVQLTHAVAAAAPIQVDENATKSKPDALPQLDVRVTDAKGDPIDCAKVTVFDWTGTFKEVGSGVANMNGEVTVSDIKFESYAYMMVSAAGYAKTMQMLNLNRGQTTTETVKMTPPVNGWINIKSADGKPVVGAELQRFTFTDINGNQTFVTPAFAKELGFVFSESDDKGRLNLPEVPEQSMVTAHVVHPDWKTAKVEIAEPKSKKLADVTLESGPRVTIKFYSNDLTKEEINRLTPKINLFPAIGGSSSAETLSHEFAIKEGRIAVTAHQVQYNELRIEIDGYFVTPQHRIYPDVEPRLNLRDRNESEFKVLIRKPVKAKGRVINSDGSPRPNAWVIGSGDSLQVDSVENGFVKTSVVKSSIAQLGSELGNATTDDDGRYEIDVVAGNCSVEIIEEGVFAKPVLTNFKVAADSKGETVIPDITLYPVPKLSGTVIGVSGDPVANAVVRMTSLGRGDADPVSVTDEQGNFELEMSRIPYSDDGGLQTDVFVVAFAPALNYAGRVAVDLTDENSVGDIKLQLGEKSPDWVLEPLADKKKDAEHPLGFSKEVIEQFKQHAAELAKKFPAGLPGKLAPTMSEGTWLNTDAKSLKDFRGKYVLLDFWFIGCGPCHRDMPSVNLAHQVFKNSGFTVVSVHTNEQKASAVKKFADDNGMNYPIVVDNAAGEIIKAYTECGLDGYPSYFLLDPDGKIVENDQVPDPNTKATRQYSLRSNKLEVINKYLSDFQTNQ